MDRRSFDLNYENNILLRDTATTRALQVRQQHFLEESRAILLDEVKAWPVHRRVWNNALAMVGPVL